MINTDGEWDGICACGKEAMDGIRCRFGATHRSLYNEDDTCICGIPNCNKYPPEIAKEKYPWEGGK